MEGKKEIYAFDFDGTLTRRDSFIAFLCHARQTRRVVAWLALHAPLLAAAKLGLYPAGKAKERVFAHFFAGTSERDYEECGMAFAARNRALLRPAGIRAVGKAVEDGATVLIVSASQRQWVAPFFAEYGSAVTVVATEPEIRNGRLTGRFATPNCKGAEKVRRILGLFPDRESYRLTSFGDSRGDREMLAMADEAHYKPFRK